MNESGLVEVRCLMNTSDRMSPKLIELTDRLRTLILASPPNAPIGQERDLCQLLGCTRAMLRQASRLLEFQGLLLVKRGAKGGYFGSRPTAEAVVETASIYLESRKTSLEESMRASMTFTNEAMKLACQCPAQHPARRELMELRDELAERYPEDMDAFEFASDEGRIDEVIFAMINNAPLELLIKILNRIATREFGERLFVRQPQRRKLFRELRFELIDALLASDSKRAVAAMERMNGCVVEWMPTESAEVRPIRRRA